MSSGDMFSSSKTNVTDSEVTDSTRVITMMSEFESLVGPHNFAYKSQRTYSKTRFSLVAPNFDDSSKTAEIDFPPTKIQRTDSSPSVHSISSPKFSALNSDLRRKLAEKEIELQRAEASITTLKSAALGAEPQTRILIMELEKKLELKSKECDSLKDKLLRLTNHIQCLEEQDTANENNFEQEKDKLKNDLSRITVKLKTVQNQKDELEIILEKTSLDKTATIKQLQNDALRLKLELDLSINEKQRREEQHKSIVKQMQEKIVVETLKVHSEMEQQISDLKSQLKRREEHDQTVKAMSLDLGRLVSLEKECNKLREDNKNLRQNRENAFLLKEKLLSAQDELAKAQQQSEEAHQLQIQLKDFQQKLKRWESVASSPSSASGFLSQLQKSEVMHTEQIGKLKSELLSAKSSIIEFENQVALLKYQLKHNRDNADTQTSINKRLGRKLLLLSKECESYKSIISSYESEVSMNVNLVQSNKINSLENLLSEYKKTIANYETDLKTEYEKLKGSEESDNEIYLKSEIHKLQNIISNLEKQVIAYESLKIPSRKEQIFHFRSNPVFTAEQRREKEYKTLKDENELLRSRIKVLEKGDVLNVTANAQQLLLEQGGETVQHLREQLATAEQKNKRFVEAFKKTSYDFREVVYRLTGFQIDLPATNKVKLSHVYAESPRDYLLFEQTSDGQVNLLETDYSKCIDHLIEEYLKKQDSIPAFLSNVTLDLFYKQTTVLNS